MSAFANLIPLSNQLIAMALDGSSDEDVRRSPSAETNPTHWIVGQLGYLGKWLGRPSIVDGR